MGITRNIYIKDSDVEAYEKMEKLLEQQGKSVSEFFADTARNFVALNEKTEEIELEGQRRKRIFKGTQLYWYENTGYELGVFHTAKGSYVYWESNAGEEEFRIHDSLEELRDDHLHAFDEDRYPGRWTEIEDADAELQGQTIVERLDI